MYLWIKVWDFIKSTEQQQQVINHHRITMESIVCVKQHQHSMIYCLRVTMVCVEY